MNFHQVHFYQFLSSDYLFDISVWCSKILSKRVFFVNRLEIWKKNVRQFKMFDRLPDKFDTDHLLGQKPKHNNRKRTQNMGFEQNNAEIKRPWKSLWIFLFSLKRFRPIYCVSFASLPLRVILHVISRGHYKKQVFPAAIKLYETFIVRLVLHVAEVLIDIPWSFGILELTIALWNDD